MSALELLCEVMSVPHDPVQYDTDTVSVTSTVENEDVEVWFGIECIIAERDSEHECYLVKWEDYPLDQCTWEPPENLESTDLIAKWQQVKEALGTAAFRLENEKNIKAYHDAQRAAEVAKAHKYDKRKKKRKKLQRRDRRVVFDDDSSEEEPLMTARRGEGLFVEQQRQTASGSRVKSTVNTRRRPSSDPYARRDITNRRVQEEDPDDQPRLWQDAGPLADFEKNKVPMMCNAWKLSSNCAYGAQQCLFLHRTYDPEGRPYQLGDIYNRVPQKYRKPPITCEYWYDGNRCKKSAEECTYAHEDTGWTEVNGRSIEREHVPPNITGPTSRTTLPYLAPKSQNPPITCHYWLRDPQGCSKGEGDCKYAHWNTGWAPRESDIKGVVQIDPDLRPRGVMPKYANPPVTCPFWLRGDNGCSRPDEECKYAHFNTGWAPPGLTSGQPLPIDSNILPRSQFQANTNTRLIEDGPITRNPRSPQTVPVSLGSRNQDAKALTCPAWLREPNGCPKSDDNYDYSHRNTGWATPKGRPFDAPVLLDPNQISRSHRDRLGDKLEPKHRNPPITCPSWLRNPHGCDNTDSECEFTHNNTGWIPRTGNGIGTPLPVQIDRNEEPRNGPIRSRVDLSALKNRNPPITCFFWLDGLNGCTYNAVDCKFAHRNTGWITRFGRGHSSDPEPIDPMRKPRFWKFDPTEEGSAQESTAQKSHVAPASRQASLKFTSGPSFDIADHFPDTCSRELVESPIVTQNALSAQVPAALSNSQLNAKIEKLYNLNVDEMFRSIVPGDDQPLERRAMLLYSPEDHPEDLDLITRWLLMHDVQVSNLWYDGAWTQFYQDASEEKSGIIISHPDFERWVDLPGLGDVLKQRIRLWSVGLQPPPEYEPGVSPNLPELRYDRVDIFPHGGFIYITEDVFNQEPQLALSIVKRFFAKVEQLRSLDGPASPWLEVNDACLLWRLCVRPELMESLYQKCEDNAAELAAQNPDYMSRAELYQLLASTKYIEQDHPTEPVSLVQDKYPILSERHVVAEHPPLDYFNRVVKSQEDASTYTIGYYAAMLSADLRRAYRHFYIVHTEPEADCAKKWKASIHNIAGIITPEQCIEELSKPSKKSIFDFLDWAMEPKEEQSAEEHEQGMGDAPMEVSPLAKGISIGSLHINI